MEISELLSELKALSHEDRIRYWEALSHNLTIACRSIWSDEGANEREKIDGMKAMNEILHRITARAAVERRQTHEWQDSELIGLVDDWAKTTPKFRGDIAWALKNSLPS